MDFATLNNHFTYGKRRGYPAWTGSPAASNLTEMWNLMLEDNRQDEIKVAAKAVLDTRYSLLQIQCAIIALIKTNTTPAQDAIIAYMEALGAEVARLIATPGATSANAVWPS